MYSCSERRTLKESKVIDGYSLGAAYDEVLS